MGSTSFRDPTPKTNIFQALFTFWGWIRGARLSEIQPTKLIFSRHCLLFGVGSWGAHLSEIQPPKLIFSRHCLLFGVGSGEHIFPRSNPQNSYFPGIVYLLGLDQGSTSFRDPTPKTNIFQALFTFWGWIRGAHLSKIQPYNIFQALFTFWGWIRGAHLSEIQPPKLIFSRHCLLFGVGSGEHIFPSRGWKFPKERIQPSTARPAEEKPDPERTESAGPPGPTRAYPVMGALVKSETDWFSRSDIEPWTKGSEDTPFTKHTTLGINTPTICPVLFRGRNFIHKRGL